MTANSPVTVSFTVTVKGAAAQLGDLYRAVRGVRHGTSLSRNVAQARSYLASGDVVRYVLCPGRVPPQGSRPVGQVDPRGHGQHADRRRAADPGRADLLTRLCQQAGLRVRSPAGGPAVAYSTWQERPSQYRPVPGGLPQ